MKKRMRLSPKNKIQLSIRFRLLAIASVFVLAAVVTILYFVFDSNKEIIALHEQNITDRFGFYRSIEAIDMIEEREADLHHIPITVILEHSDFKSKNLGGRLFDPSARDLIFTRKGNRIPLKSQIEDYDASRGLVNATVWIDTLKKNEKPVLDVYYSASGIHAITPPFAGYNLNISMNEGLVAHIGPQRISAIAVGTFKANGLMGNGRGFSNERGDYLQYTLNAKNTFDNGFTMSAWIYPELRNQSQIIYGYNDLAGAEVHVGINKHNTIFIKLIKKGEEQLFAAMNGRLNFNQWSHITLVSNVKENEIILHMNGEEILVAKTKETPGRPETLFLGRSRQNATEGFTGIVDQVELLPEVKSLTWSKFSYNSAIHPISQWTYGIENSSKTNTSQRETTRNALRHEAGKNTPQNSIKFQTLQPRSNIHKTPATVSSSATLMQQKLQQIQQKVRKEDFAKN